MHPHHPHKNYGGYSLYYSMWTTLESSVMNYNNCQLNAIYTYTSILTTYNKLPKPIYYLSLEPFCAYASKNLGQNLGQKLGTDGQTDKTRYRVALQLQIQLIYLLSNFPT